ncbi:MAG TPA: hypothetical protein VOA41_03750 [Candidatus Dormibacteraeota bacterium]|nr:hypothetical protein [Candidatus Dormibacteraeota bacterium]
MPRRAPLGLGTLSLGLFLIFIPSARAQSRIAGSYHCSHARIEGKSTKCSSPPLILNEDGSYQLLGKEGRYAVKGQWVYLDQTSLQRKGQLQPGYRIAFQYRENGKRCEIIFERHRVDLGKTSLS